jgi:hypothetical protein
VPAAHRIVRIGEVDQFRRFLPRLGEERLGVLGVVAVGDRVQGSAEARDVEIECRVGAEGGDDRVAGAHEHPDEIAEETVDTFPTTIFSGATPWWAARAARRSWFSGSPYFHTSAAAACMASMAFGEGPKTLSFAPMRARKGWPRLRSCASGPTKGTLAGREATRGV